VHDFRPRFCPWRACPEHQRNSGRLSVRAHGAYLSRRGRRIPRFLCLRCRRTFSQSSFSLLYYLKRPELLRPVAALLQAGAAHRQIARSLACAPSTVTRLTARLGRHAILLHAHALASLPAPLVEPVVLDHFEVFEFTQDCPFGVATAVGARSWFWYLLDPAPHRRTGRVSAFQAHRLAQRPRRPRFGGYRGSARRVFDQLRRLAGEESLEVRSDDHPAYMDAAAGRGIRLRRYRNPPRGPKGAPRTREARVRDQALFPVDALHQLLRHSGAHYRRETLAFGRRLNAVLERLFLTTVWRNFVKPLSENRPRRGTPAMQLRLAREPWNWKRVLARRLFPRRERLPGVWQVLYKHAWPTPVLPRITTHRLKQAY
jgi:transposase-like protein